MWKRNKGDERRQELTVFKGPLFGKHLAIVRASWRGSHGKAAQVQEVVIKDRFDDAGIEIPFPQRTVWFRTEEPRVDPRPEAG